MATESYPILEENKYFVGEELGKGAYAIVLRCTHKDTQKQFAVKIIDKTKAGPKDISDVQHEVIMMKAIGKHDFVVQLHEFFDTPKQMFLILDLLEGGMLFDRIVSLKHYSEAQASRLVKNFLLALEHIHSKNIMHRDLKPENLLLKKSESSNEEHLTNVALADFGLAGRIPGQTCCGSPSYIAPEVISVGYLRTQKEPYDGKCDIWSLGTITYILLSGKMPFHGRNFKEIFAKIVKNHWSFAGDAWNNVTDSAKDFIKTMLTLDPKKRPSATEALKHPWVATVQSDKHLGAGLEGIKAFTAQQKLRSAFAVFRATNAFFGSLDRTPPFMKYLSHKDSLSTVIESKSQTDANKLHYIDFSRALLRGQPGWKLQDCCTCDSASVCRHIQNVHEYLFVGSHDFDVAPFINTLLAAREELEIDIEENISDKKLRMKLEEINNVISAAKVFREEYLKVPPESKKLNMMLQATRSQTGASPFANLIRKKAQAMQK